MNDSHTWARRYRKIFLFLLRFKWCRQKWICISVYLFTASFVYKNTRATYSHHISTRKSTKKINAVHERSLRIIRNDYESLYPLLLEEVHQTTFHQRYINSLMTKVYKYLNGHSPDIMNDIFKLRDDTCNLRNFHIFQKLPHLPDRKPSFTETRTRCYSISRWPTLETSACWYPWGSFFNSSVAYVWGMYAYRNLL